MRQERPVQVAIYVPATILDQLDEQLKGASRSAWIVDAIRERLERERVDARSDESAT